MSLLGRRDGTPEAEVSHQTQQAFHPGGCTNEPAREPADLHSDEAARFVSLMPARHQIAIITAPGPATHARLARDCQPWRCTVPLLTAAPVSAREDNDGADDDNPNSPLAAHRQSVAKWGIVGPTGRQ